jgi:hypothetical protein
MSFNRRVWPLFLVALLSAFAGFAPQSAEAQVIGPDSKGDVGFDSVSLALPGWDWDTFRERHEIAKTHMRLVGQVNLELTFNLDVPRFYPNRSSGFDNSDFQLVKLNELAGQTDDPSLQLLAPQPVLSTPSQVFHGLLEDSKSPAGPNAGSALPNPQQPSDQGWHASISPYLWLPGLHGTIGALGHGASVNASFSDIFSNFSFALMGTLDTRYNRIVMPLDFMWIRLTNDKAFPFDVLATSAKIKVNLDVLTQKFGYRVVDTEKFKLDALAGVRYWHAGTTVDLVSSVLPKTNFYGSADWVDAVGGARFQVLLAPKLALTIAGDAGGGGANSDYQVAGLIGWEFKKFTLQTGWRYMTVNYRPSGGTICDVAISGLILGATIPLK